MSPPRRVIVVPSRIEDVYRLASDLREADRDEIQALGIDPKAAIRLNFRNAILRKTFFVDNRIAAMAGLCGTMLGSVGHPYLVTTPMAAKTPVAFIKEARKAVGEMLILRELLVGEVAASYAGACRMLEMVGFTLSTPHPLGLRGALFRTFTLKRKP